MKRVGLAFLATLATVGVLEGGLRLAPAALWKNAVRFDAPFDWLMYDPILGWENRPYYEQPGFRINSFGYRGPEITRRKPPGTVRIVCIGDSRTFGTWLDFERMRYDNDYASPLQALLHDGVPTKTEVINAGVIGYSSAHGLRQFRTRLLRLDPDIIIVGFGFNDHSLAWNAALRCLEPRNVLPREVLYDLADAKIFQLGLRAYQAIAALHPAPLALHWVEPDEYGDNLRRFAQMANQYHVHLLLLSQALRAIELGESKAAFPTLKPPPDAYGLFGARDLAGLHRIEQTYQDVLYRVAQSDGIPLADAAAAFAAHRDEPLFSEYDMVHPNLAGARVIAETVYAQLRQRDWLVSAALRSSVVSPARR